MNTAVERCPMCNGVLAIVGRVHLCVPRADIVQAMTDARERELREKMAADKSTKSSRGGVESRHAPTHRQSHAPSGGRSGSADRDGVSGQQTDLPGYDPAKQVETAGVATGPRETAKPRAKKGTGVYGFRNADEHRTYMREYMRKRRVKV